MDSVILSQSCGVVVKKIVSLLQSKSNGSGAGAGAGACASVQRSAFLGNSLKKLTSKISHQKVFPKNFKVVAEYDKSKQTLKDRWQGLAYDESDDQQDITRGKGMVDTLFQAPMGTGALHAIMSSYDYISQGS
ncbi:hypothetical protein DITRI_Ditri12bG0170000 [Diplodiscus trichospermus]